jgi:hypothetical protein
MTSAARILAAWLSPVVWLAMCVLILDRGADGLWVGLALTVAPLVALGVGAPPLPAAEGGREPLFPVLVVLVTAAVLLWAHLALAGDLAAWLGAPRWEGIVVAVGTAWALAAWRGAGRLTAALALAALVAVGLPLAHMARAAGVGPLGAWERVAAQPAFRFPPSSPWVTTGRTLALARGPAPLVFEEEHRVTAPGGGRLRARTVDGRRVAEIEWELEAGQSVVLRPGDQLLRDPALPLRLEPGKRVPGAPASGPAWADGRLHDWPRRLALVATILLGAVALLRAGVTEDPPRPTVALVGAGLALAFLLAQSWAVYAALRAPDLFFGGVTAERLLDAQALQLGGAIGGRALQGLLLLGGLAGFLATSVALRERLGALDRTGGGEIGHDLGLWGGVLGVAGLASLWPVDPWRLVLAGLGGAASALAPAVLLPPPAGRPGAASAAGLAGLVTFAALAALGRLGPGEGVAAAVLAYPAAAGVAVGLLVLWIVHLVARR